MTRRHEKVCSMHRVMWHHCNSKMMKTNGFWPQCYQKPLGPYFKIMYISWKVWRKKNQSWLRGADREIHPSRSTFVCLIWFLRPSNNFSFKLGRVFLGWTSTKLGLMCLAQGHNSVTPVRLEPASLWSQVKHSTTEPLHSLIPICHQ